MFMDHSHYKKEKGGEMIFSKITYKTGIIYRTLVSFNVLICFCFCNVKSSIHCEVCFVFVVVCLEVTPCNTLCLLLTVLRNHNW